VLHAIIAQQELADMLAQLDDLCRPSRDMSETDGACSRHTAAQARADRTKGRTGLTTPDGEELVRLRKAL
jgi:hypothetical protein